MCAKVYMYILKIDLKCMTQKKAWKMMLILIQTQSATRTVSLDPVLSLFLPLVTEHQISVTSPESIHTRFPESWSCQLDPTGSYCAPEDHVFSAMAQRLVRSNQLWWRRND